MNLEVHKPEAVHCVNVHIHIGHFHNADDLLEKALDPLDEPAATAVPPTATKRGRAGGVTGTALSRC